MINMEFHDKTKKYRCCICEDEFNTKTEIKKHQKERDHAGKGNTIATQERCLCCSGFFCTF